MPAQQSLSTMQWQDVTDLIKTTSEGMDLGQIIHSDHFDLFDVMSALEIMDPKMDPNVGGNRILSIDERIENGSLNFQLNDERALIQIMDRLTQAEFTWYTGKSLPQTLFTCLYLHRISNIANSTFRVFCKSVYYMIREIIELMARTPIREEEEFSINTFSFDVYSEDLRNIFQELKEEEDSLKNILQKEKNPERKSLIQAIYSRIRFRRVYLQIHENFSTYAVDTIEKTKSLLNLAEEEFNKIIIQHESLKIDSDSSDIQGFASNFTTRISSPHPLKAIELLSFNAAKIYVLAYLNHLDFIARGLKYRDNFLQILDLFHIFSQLQASVIARARMYNCYYHNERICGVYEPSTLVKKSLLCLPSLTSSHKSFIENPERLEDGKHWIHNIGVCFFFIMHALCLNRGKLREKLRGLIMELADVIHKGEQFDQICIEESKEENAIPILTQFLFDKILGVMELYLILGLELELYDPIELGYIFFYLETLSSRRNMNYAAINELNTLSKKEKKSIRKDLISKRKNTIHLIALIHHGYSKLLHGLSVIGFYETPTISKKQFFTFGSEQLRYNHRFQPFMLTHIPQFISYQTYQSQLLNDIEEDLSQTLKANLASQSFSQALNAFSNVIEMSKSIKMEFGNILTTCEVEFLDRIIETSTMNTVTCKILPLLASKGTLKTVDFEFKFKYPIVKLK